MSDTIDDVLTDAQVQSIADYGRQRGGTTQDCVSDLAASHELLRRLLIAGREKLARLEALFQQTHGVHSSWVAKAQLVDALEAACARKDSLLSANCPWFHANGGLYFCGECHGKGPTTGEMDHLASCQWRSRGEEVGKR